MEIIDRSNFVVSAQVMGEFVAVVRRKASPRLSEAEIDRWLLMLALRDPLAVDAETVRRGRAISADHGINYYDGAILAAAERLGCDTVLSEDMSDGRTYGGVTVRNPFKDL
jgi:predicted nucleic acid-binding protein